MNYFLKQFFRNLLRKKPIRSPNSCAAIDGECGKCLFLRSGVLEPKQKTGCTRTPGTKTFSLQRLFSPTENRRCFYMYIYIFPTSTTRPATASEMMRYTAVLNARFVSTVFHGLT